MTPKPLKELILDKAVSVSVYKIGNPKLINRYKRVVYRLRHGFDVENSTIQRILTEANDGYRMITPELWGK
jgi:hypothetical protein